jgi:hypothetical protein
VLRIVKFKNLLQNSTLKAIDKTVIKKRSIKLNKLTELLTKSYSYNSTIKKLIRQLIILEGFTLREILLLAHLYINRRPIIKDNRHINKALLDTSIDIRELSYRTDKKIYYRYPKYCNIGTLKVEPELIKVPATS